jgi:hypothetical protein
MADDDSSQNRKTLRSFYARDYLWELFEYMSDELGCSTEYLLNEAMREYAKNRDFKPSDRTDGKSKTFNGATLHEPPGASDNRKEPPPPPESGKKSESGERELVMIFDGEEVPIQTERFIIGRAKQESDLTIRDGNISRKHCAIVKKDDDWFIQDLDSTNGVEYQGSRIESKKIEDGDVVYLTNHPLQFTFRH